MIDAPPNRTVQLTEVSTPATARAVSDSPIAAGLLTQYSRYLGEFQRQISASAQIQISAARVCDSLVPLESRLKAAAYLIRLWNPYPFDPKAKLALRFAGVRSRGELHSDLALSLLSGAEESVKALKPRRIGRLWLKDESGKRAKISLLDLEADDFLRALRTLSIRAYEKLVLDTIPTAISREMRDSDVDSFDDPNSTETNTRSLGEPKSLLQSLSPREQQLWEYLKQDMSKVSAARRMNISPSTARVLFSRIRTKLRK